MRCHYAVAVVAALAAVGVAVWQPAPAPSPKFEHLDPELQAWFQGGSMMELHDGRSVFVRVEEYVGDQAIDADVPTFILVHGFPSSSFEWRHVVPLLRQHGRVVMWDSLGFGFSDKPAGDDKFSYALLEQAEYAVELWRRLGIQHAHVIAHDMGDSIVTEILARYSRNLWPEPLDFHSNGGFFDSVVFTNGGMRMQFADLRITQKVLLTSSGPWFNNLIMCIDPDNVVASQQLRSIWSPTADPEPRDREIKLMMELNKFKGGGQLLHRTISYLPDRFRFEDRWMRALRLLDAQTSLHPRILWGDADAVAPVGIPNSLHEVALKTHPPEFLRGAGHFLMLEQPEEWAVRVLRLTGVV